MQKDEMKSLIDQQVQSTSWWQRLAGSQFVDGMTTLLAQIVARVSHATDRALQESFLSLATQRASILAGAEDVGYVVKKISPSFGQVSITNVSNRRITMPAYTPLLSGVNLSYVCIDAIDIASNETITAQIKQLELVQIRQLIDEPKAWLSLVLPKKLSLQTHTVDVYVDGIKWQNAYKFRNCAKNSRAYMEYYKSTDQIGIRFGNGVTGKMPARQSEIKLDVWVTAGVTNLISDQKLKIAAPFDARNADLKIVTSSIITGGSAAESIESVRAGALYSTPYDNQLVWSGDYEHYIRSNVSDLIWLSVWGEKEQENLVGHKSVEHINRIYIAAHSAIKSQEQLEREILDLLNAQPEYNKHYVYRSPKYLTFTVNINGFVYGHADPTDVESINRESLVNNFGIDAQHKSDMMENDVIKIINENVPSLGIKGFSFACDIPDHVAIDTYLYLDIDASTIKFEYFVGDTNNQRQKLT